MWKIYQMVGVLQSTTRPWTRKKQVEARQSLKRIPTKGGVTSRKLTYSFQWGNYSNVSNKKARPHYGTFIAR